MPYFELPDAKLWFDEHGAGDEIVLASASGFERYPALLSEKPTHCHVFTIQARGFGRSTHLEAPPEQGWLDQWGEDVLTFADALGVDRFIYTGVSHGAGIGWHLARRCPERLKALISVVGAPHDRSGDTSSSAGRRAIVESRKDPAVIERQLRSLGGRTDTPEQAAVRDATIRKLLHRHLQFSEEEARINQGMPFPEATSNDELAAVLRGIEVPVLILAGMRDGVISPEATLRAARNVPHAKSVLFEDEGHFVSRERPERLAAEVAVYLRQLAA